MTKTNGHDAATPITVTLSLYPEHLSILDTVAAQMPRKSDPRKPETRSAAGRELIEVGFLLMNNPALLATIRAGEEIKSRLNNILAAGTENGASGL